MTPELQESTKRRGPSDTQVLAIIPAIGYAMAYLFESGYCRHFGIPAHLLTVSTTTILLAITSLATALFFVLWFANTLGALVSPDVFKTPLRRAITSTIGVVIFMGCILLLARPAGSGWILLLTVSFIVFSNFIFPLISQRKTKGYTNKLARQEEIERNVEFVHERILNRISSQSRVLMGLCLIAILGAWLHGPGKARSQTEFLVPTDLPDYVVVREHNEQFILAKFDRASKKLEGELVFADVAAGDFANPVRYTRQAVGPSKAPDSN